MSTKMITIQIEVGGIFYAKRIPLELYDREDFVASAQRVREYFYEFELVVQTVRF